MRPSQSPRRKPGSRRHCNTEFWPTLDGVLPSNDDFKQPSKLQLTQASSKSACENEQVHEAESHPSGSQLERETGKVQPNKKANPESQRWKHKVEKKLCATALFQA